MARSSFGGTNSDWLFNPFEFGERDLLALETGTTTLDFYSAVTGGTHYTDLLENAVAVSHITVTGHQVQRFSGPDGVLGMWVDKGDGSLREYIEARDLAAIAASTTAAAASATAAAASATAAAASTASKMDKGSLFINVMDAPYSAVGDGVANDRAAIQAALDAASGSGTVYLPEGTYKISGADLEVTVGSSVLRGAGDRSILSFTGCGLVYDGTGPGYLTEVGLHDLRITRTSTAGAALRFAGGGSSTGVAHFNVSNVRVYGSTGECLLVDGAFIGTFTGCYFIGGVTGIKIAFEGTSVVSGNNISFHGGETQGCGTAASLDSPFGVNFYGHAFEGSTTAGVDAFNDALGLGFYGCYWEGNAAYDLRVGNTSTRFYGPCGVVVHGGFFEDGAGAKSYSIRLIRGLGVDIRSNLFGNYGAEPISVAEAAAGVVRGTARDNVRNGDAALATVALGGATQFNKSLIGTDETTSTGIAWHKAFSGVLDFGSIAAHTQAELTVTATGVATGDDVTLHTTNMDAGLMPYASVTAANTITVRVVNITASAVDPGARTYRFRVWR